MASHWIQHLSTAAVACLAVLLAFVAVSARHYQAIGREALLAVSAYLGITAVVRVLSAEAMITPETARVAIGLAAFGCLAVLAQLAYLKHLHHCLRRDA